MAAESGTAPETDDAENHDNHRPVPNGWRDIGNGLLRLDPTHPSYPSAQKRHEKGTRKRLAANPKVTEMAKVLQERFLPIANTYRRIQRERNKLAATCYASDCMTYISDELIAAAESCAGPGTASVPVCRDYLAEVTVLPEIAVHLIDPLEPVFLRANASPHPDYLIVNPGDIVMRFTGATTRERGETLSGPISELQSAWGYAQADTGGRPAGPADEDQAMTIAKLHHWESWSHRKIAAFLGWLRDDEDWSDEKVRRRIEQRIRRYLRQGESLLDAEADQTGTPWRKPPRHMAPLERSRRSRGDPPM